MSSAFLDLLAEIPGKTVTLATGRMLFQRGDWHHLAGELNVSPEALYRELGKRRRG